MNLIEQKITNSKVSMVGPVEQSAFGILGGDLRQNLVLIADHARNSVPEDYGDLGLPASEFERHIAYDIGSEELTRKLSARLNVPAVYSKFSRLLIDPNRGKDDPTLIMKISDGAVVPGNINVNATERQNRIKRFYQPYHDGIDQVLDRAADIGVRPFILSIHSFTPSWKGVPRPWHAGILWKNDGRFSLELLAALRNQPGLIVGENEPYAGGIAGDSIDTHAYSRELPAALIEIRQDLVSDQAGVDEWVNRLAEILPQLTIGKQN